eukprot:TRINITY_DN26081_c0_g1_i1.p1 TRINITY_DN26081_c0_g1~~TRINITY_DN26081_c0_g1_i1.p1  ORF type:complete len:175 (-),score=45.07 TRINITY_DN26081_c0_g1_i1:40-564(-)
MLLQNPLIFQFLDLIAETYPCELCKYFPCIRFLLSSMSSKWALKVSVEDRDIGKEEFTEALIILLQKAQWIPFPMTEITGEIKNLPKTVVSTLLRVILDFVIRNPPLPSQYIILPPSSLPSPNQVKISFKRQYPSFDWDDYLLPIKRSLHTSPLQCLRLYRKLFSRERKPEGME